MGGPCTVDGESRAELDNFYECNFTADGVTWPSSEHYYQASKFPDDEALREKLRAAPSGMRCWSMGQDHPLRPDWEEVKVEAMYRANHHKFSQNRNLRTLLVSTQGPISAQGGLFWKTWNEVLLERIREELRDYDECDKRALRLRFDLMEAYKEAAKSGDEKAMEVATVYASRRELPPKRDSSRTLTVSGFDVGQYSWLGSAFDIEPLKPEANGQPHYTNPDGAHLYLGSKHGEYGWCLDQDFCPTEKTATFYLPVEADAGLPLGTRTWKVFLETGELRESDLSWQFFSASGE